MSGMPSTKRRLFGTPGTPKRRKTTAKVVARIPKALLPEMKQFIVGNLSSDDGTSRAWSSIPVDMSQGDASSQFDGSRFRIAKIRVYYNYTQISLTDAIRLSVVIPKDVSATPSTTGDNPWDTNINTVLYDKFVSHDLLNQAGYFDVTGPINVDMSTTGTSCLRNAVHIHVSSTSKGNNMRFNTAYAVWFTS